LIKANEAVLNAGGNVTIDSMNQIAHLTAHSTGTGNIFFRNGIAVTLEDVTTANGWIRALTNGPSIFAKDVHANNNSAAPAGFGNGADVFVGTLSGSGDVTVGSVSATGLNQNIYLQSAGGSIIGQGAGTNVTGRTLTLYADDGIYGQGTPATFYTNTSGQGYLTTNVDTIAGGAGDVINVHNLKTLTIGNTASNEDLAASRAGSQVNVIADGDIVLSRVADFGFGPGASTVSAGSGVTLEAQGEIKTGTGVADFDISTQNLRLSAKNGIGDAAALKTNVSQLQASNTVAGNVNLTNSKALEVNHVDSINDLNLRVEQGDLLINGLIQSTTGAVHLVIEDGSLSSTIGSLVAADKDSSFLMPHGTIGLTNPIDVNINGSLLLEIGGTDGVNSGFITGSVVDPVVINTPQPADHDIPRLFNTIFPTPQNPPGNVFYNGIQIWPPITPTIPGGGGAGTGALTAQIAAAAFDDQFVFPTIERLSETQLRTFDVISSATQAGPVFLYHPLVELDSGAYEADIHLDEGAFDFIDGRIEENENLKKKKKLVI
jgi:hypothetical protein